MYDRTDKSPQQRLQVLSIPVEVLTKLFQQQIAVPLPPKAKIVNVGTNFLTKGILLYIYHPDWENISEGVSAPIIPLKVEWRGDNIDTVYEPEWIIHPCPRCGR